MKAWLADILFTQLDLARSALIKVTQDPEHREQERGTATYLTPLERKMLDTLELCEDALKDVGRLDDGTPSIQALTNIRDIKANIGYTLQPERAG